MKMIFNLERNRKTHMKQKGQYATNQRKVLLEYLESIKGEHTTVSKISSVLKEQGVNIGTTTIYRQMERMVNEGLVEKYIIDSTSPACFVFVGNDHEHSSGNNHTCYHCKCEKCGKIIHLECETIKALETHLWNDHKFAFDNLRTVFYGTCSACQKM